MLVPLEFVEELKEFIGTDQADAGVLVLQAPIGIVVRENLHLIRTREKRQNDLVEIHLVLGTKLCLFFRAYGRRWARWSGG